MTVSIDKTEAETALAAYFAEVGERLPGETTVAALRQRAMARFDELGLPHRRIEEWKYTDLRASLKAAFAPAFASDVSVERSALYRALGAFAGIDAIRLVFVDGRFDANLSDSAVGIASAVQFMPMSQALGDRCFAEEHGKTNPSTDDSSIHALNTAFMSDGAALMITASPLRPLHIVNVASGASPAALTTRNVISVGEGAEVALLESHVTLGDQAVQLNALTHLGIAAGARVMHIKVQQEALASTHLSTWLVDLDAKSVYRGFQYSTGATLARNEVNINFKGADAAADISGVNLLRGDQHCDTTMVIDHAEPGCESRELFKLVLDDRARGVFQGKVVVHPRAQKTDGKQMAQALMLSEACEFDSKPELEIYADDVACGHGSTCAELDPDLVFYCRARGIPEATVRALLIESFVAEAIEKVENEAVREALGEAARQWFAGR